MLYGVLTPDSGLACIDGMDIGGETSKARAHLGVLPHAAGLYGNLTARENIHYFGSLQGVGGERLASRTAELVRIHTTINGVPANFVHSIFLTYPRDHAYVAGKRSPRGCTQSA